jgi:hypothetical protein
MIEKSRFQLRLEEMRTMKMKRFIFEEAQAGPDSDRIMKQNTARCCRAGGGGREEYIRDRKCPVPNRSGQEMRVMRVIISRSKKLSPWYVVEVHVIIAAMGGGRGHPLQESWMRFHD